jgi:plasmid stabilization system protein ParE
MSSPNCRIELSQQAKEDFRDILSYTLTTWGESQLAKYRASINDALHVILHNPSAGRPSVKPTLKVSAVEHHRIFIAQLMTPFMSCAFYTSAWTRPGICEPAL